MNILSIGKNSGPRKNFPTPFLRYGAAPATAARRSKIDEISQKGLRQPELVCKSSRTSFLCLFRSWRSFWGTYDPIWTGSLGAGAACCRSYPGLEWVLTSEVAVSRSQKSRWTHAKSKTGRTIGFQIAMYTSNLVYRLRGSRENYRRPTEVDTSPRKKSMKLDAAIFRGEMCWKYVKIECLVRQVSDTPLKLGFFFSSRIWSKKKVQKSSTCICSFFEDLVI